MAALAEALKAGLAEPFARAVETLSVISGRVIVTGVGKSGHIGSKIAATLASTGTPAFFVHPSEANHGDLGMIARDDAIIALSWSGESFELKGIVSYARRFAIPLIAVTAGEASALAREAERRAVTAARAGGLSAWAGADHLDAAAAGDRRCARRGAARGARLHGRSFPHLPSGRPARRQSHPCRRDHAQRRRDAGRAARHEDAGSGHDAGQEALRLRLRHRRGGAAGRHRHRRRPRPQPPSQHVGACGRGHHDAPARRR